MSEVMCISRDQGLAGFWVVSDVAKEAALGLPRAVANDLPLVIQVSAPRICSTIILPLRIAQWTPTDTCPTRQVMKLLLPLLPLLLIVA